MVDTPASGRKPEDPLTAAVTDLVAAWRADNPTATSLPRSLRREISGVIRTNTRAQALDAAITRARVELEILHHQKAVVSLGIKPDSTDQDDPAYTAWSRKNTALSEAARALERRIHELPHLSATDRGQAVRALERAHLVPSSVAGVRWEASGRLEALRARVTEKLSAIRLGVTSLTGPVRRFGEFWLAQRQASRPEDRTEQARRDWLTPGQAAALAELSTAAQSYETAAQQARAATDAQTDLAAKLSEFQTAFTRTQQMGVSSERINAELRTAHTELEAAGQHPQSRWAKLQAAARASAPLTPPPAAAASTGAFAFGATPASPATPLSATARRTR
ncbi:hypothetical protein DFR70_12666 [Nocardia tenerifensis]|uniref:Uncharacterized protein n=1 Tax=Nocardia tenerifensis TaxID=228006 RepID=A0A318KAT1_9NOCA|nr:hypothetical protein [Nocardia tenerifensis]PXX53945.1 hypothetical protein DFR70_12666 [Nocardia tenerifensis]